MLLSPYISPDGTNQNCSRYQKRTTQAPPAQHHMGLNKARLPPLGTAEMFLKCQRQPASLPSSAMFRVMGIDFRHCFRAELKACAFAACQARRPDSHKGLRTGSLVCGAWESRVPQGLFSSLTEIRSMAQAVNIFVLLTRACQGLQPGEKEV